MVFCGGYLEGLIHKIQYLVQPKMQSGTVMCIPTHNYQVACPHRLRAFEEALEYITGHSDVWVTTGREIAAYFIETYYDECLSSIASYQGNGGD